MNRIKHRLSIFIVAGLLVACGGGDDDAADSDGDDTEQQNDDEAPADASDGDADDSSDVDNTVSGDSDTDDTEASDDSGDGDTDEDADDDTVIIEPTEDDGDSGDDDMIVISDFDDIPRECVELMGEFLREIEPIVSELDWQNATIDDLETFGTGLDVPIEDFDRRSAETGCDRYDIGADDDQSLDFAIQVAEREAPGTVGWLQFIAGMSALGETVDDVVDPDDSDDGTAAGTGDCQDVQNVLRDKATEYGTFEDMPVNEAMELVDSITALYQVCTIAEIEAFSEDPVISTFLDG